MVMLLMNNELTNVLKNVLLSMGLVDTGNLLNNTFINFYIRESIYIDIHTTDYFYYLNIKYNIIGAFANSVELSNIIEKEINVLLENKLNQFLNDKTNENTIDINKVDLNKIIVLINGN